MGYSLTDWTKEDEKVAAAYAKANALSMKGCGYCPIEHARFVARDIARGDADAKIYHRALREWAWPDYPLTIDRRVLIELNLDPTSEAAWDAAYEQMVRYGDSLARPVLGGEGYLGIAGQYAMNEWFGECPSESVPDLYTWQEVWEDLNRTVRRERFWQTIDERPDVYHMRAWWLIQFAVCFSKPNRQNPYFNRIEVRRDEQ